LIVTLNLFQGLWPALAISGAPDRKARPWMLKRVQHDEGRRRPSSTKFSHAPLAKRDILHHGRCHAHARPSSSATYTPLGVTFGLRD